MKFDISCVKRKRYPKQQHGIQYSLDHGCNKGGRSLWDLTASQRCNVIIQQLEDGGHSYDILGAGMLWKPRKARKFIKILVEECFDKVLNEEF
jgi:hypothetical protein